MGLPYPAYRQPHSNVFCSLYGFFELFNTEPSDPSRSYYATHLHTHNTMTVKHRTIRRLSIERRDQRPYVTSLVREHREALDALLAALCDLEDSVYSDAEWCAMVGRIHEARAEVGRLQWSIFRACGYSLPVLRRLTQRG